MIMIKELPPMPDGRVAHEGAAWCVALDSS
jgi:hypothetical protein